MIITLFSGFVAGCGERVASTLTTPPGESSASAANTGLAGIGKGPAPLLLGTAENYVILATTAILTVGGSTVAGNLGVKPAVADQSRAIALQDAPIQFSSSPEVPGRIFAADYVVQTPAKLTEAIAGMNAAYADAASRKADFTELGSGIIGGMTLAAGTYKWNTALLIPANITLYGDPNHVWIFQVSQGLIQASAARIILAGGARAKNVFWQVGGAVDVKSSAHMEGVILSNSSITLGKGASANSRLLAQTTVSLDANAVTQPAP